MYRAFREAEIKIPADELRHVLLWLLEQGIDISDVVKIIQPANNIDETSAIEKMINVLKTSISQLLLHNVNSEIVKKYEQQLVDVILYSVHFDKDSLLSAVYLVAVLRGEMDAVIKVDTHDLIFKCSAIEKLTLACKERVLSEAVCEQIKEAVTVAD
ncbi:MAG: hypothetical protein QXS16_04080 [Pyrobaculum sp.]